MMARGLTGRAWLVWLAAAVLALAPLVFGDYWTGLLTQAVIFGGVAVGLDILVGFAGMATLGHGAFFGLAGYGLALGVLRWGLNPWVAAGVGVVIVGVLAITTVASLLKSRNDPEAKDEVLAEAGDHVDTDDTPGPDWRD